MNIVITGATGVVGMALLKRLSELGHHILVLAHPGSARIDRLKKYQNIEVLESAMSDYSNLDITKDYDIFFNLAWAGGHDRASIAINLSSVYGSICAVDLADRLKCKVFIGAGSQAECGRQETPIRSDTYCQPDSPYAAAKLCAYYFTKFRAQQYNLKFIWARILSVYGPYDGEQTMVMSTIRRLLLNQEPAFTNGDQVWNFLYADDAANMLIKIAFEGTEGATYIIGSGEARKLKDYIVLILRKFHLNPTSFLGKIPYQGNEFMHVTADQSEFNKFFGSIPITSFDHGIDLTIEYCKNNPV